MALVKCPECGNSVSDRAGACPKCGLPIEEIMRAQMTYCTECGNPLQPGATFCTECGAPAGGAYPARHDADTRFTRPAVPPVPPVHPVPQSPGPQYRNAASGMPGAPSSSSPVPPPASAVPPVPPVMPDEVKPKKAPQIPGDTKQNNQKIRTGIPPMPVKEQPQIPGSPEIPMPEAVIPKAAPAPSSAPSGTKPEKVVSREKHPAFDLKKKNAPSSSPAPEDAVRTTPPPTPASPAAPGPVQKPETNTTAIIDDSQFYEPYEEKVIETDGARNMATLEENRGKKTLLMAGVAALAVIMVGVCVWLFVTTGNDEEQPVSPVITEETRTQDSATGSAMPEEKPVPDKPETVQDETPAEETAATPEQPKVKASASKPKKKAAAAEKTASQKTAAPAPADKKQSGNGYTSKRKSRSLPEY